MLAWAAGTEGLAALAGLPGAGVLLFCMLSMNCLVFGRGCVVVVVVSDVALCRVPMRFRPRITRTTTPTYLAREKTTKMMTMVIIWFDAGAAPGPAGLPFFFSLAGLLALSGLESTSEISTMPAPVPSFLLPTLSPHPRRRRARETGKN